MQGADPSSPPRDLRATRRFGAIAALFAVAGAMLSAPPAAAAAPPVSEVRAVDVSGDSGTALSVTWKVQDADLRDAKVRLERSATDDERKADPKTEWIELGEFGAADGIDGAKVGRIPTGEPVRIRVAIVAADGSVSTFAVSEPATAVRNLIFLDRLPLLGWLLMVVAAVVTWVALARAGRPVRIRRIAALEAVDEAVGRATEMGREILFVPGIQDMNDIQTVAGMTVLGRIARTAAEYDASLVVPTCRSIVMTAARETVQAAHYAVGRPETYREGNVNYITDEQFGYVAYLAGRMVREKPAACFYMGAFYAESLILAENGNAIGAIQIAGTAEPSQLPFFVAACDYTLIGEEFFAASAYLSGERDQLGSIKGQDLGKAIAMGMIVLGCLGATLTEVAPGLFEAGLVLMKQITGG